ncbi:probable RNA polymerase II nuclear localization protein SLC7A6OS [Pocillopora damicornis]|uniref:probable RNA polymerase II nuclear localization protein SLC7A6OS n=1 Tax=Pocillopora damicornis TaxID=46731 RepID=UPI000F5510C0|nr:probable RNA polymerase II nuclear localization protein SLC7A6OS [Pocillopora damicornis]
MAADDRSVVLRIKRKRTEDPLDALLVAQVLKKPYIARKEDCEKDATYFKNNESTSTDTVERVFKFVGSVPQGDETKRKDLLTKIKQSINHEDLAKSHIQTQQAFQDRLRKQKKLLNQEARFKVISSNRENDHGSTSQSESKGNLTKVDAASGGAADDVDLEVQRLLSVYDLVKDQESMSEKRREERRSRKAQQAADVNAILCNSVKMIREKLAVTDDSSKERTEQKKSESNGYVYDFYYANDNLGQLGDIVEVLPFDADLVHESLDEDFGEIYDDEDDSNDEGNWRNDYPDEDDQWSDSSQDKRYYEDYGFNSDEEYRRYAFDEDRSDEDRSNEEDD